MTLSLIKRLHVGWLADCGFLVVLLNSIAVFLIANRRLPAILRNIHRLTDDAGVREMGSTVNRRRKYLWLAAGALLVAAALRATAIVVKPRYILFNQVSLGSALVAMVAAGAFTWTLRKLLRSTQELTSREKGTLTPPKAAKFVLLMIPKAHREHLVGDLEEEYATIVLPEYGEKRAQLWYWWQVTASIAPLIWSQLRRIVAVAFLLKRVR
jgi:hypothetical protein